MGPTWGPRGTCRPQVGPMLAPWPLLSGTLLEIDLVIVDITDPDGAARHLTNLGVSSPSPRQIDHGNDAFLERPHAYEQQMSERPLDHPAIYFKSQVLPAVICHNLIEYDQDI